MTKCVIFFPHPPTKATEGFDVLCDDGVQTFPYNWKQADEFVVKGSVLCNALMLTDFQVD